MKPDATFSREKYDGANNREGLLDRLHTLLSKLSDTTDVIKAWPADSGEGDNDSSVHYDATTGLIESIHGVVGSLRAVEDKVVQLRGKRGDEVSDSAARMRQVMDSPVPLDLLDLMDYGNGLNPECFTKQLIREALRQLSGLRRRKVALEMLGKAMEAGLKKKDEEQSAKIKGDDQGAGAKVSDLAVGEGENRGTKRPREDHEVDEKRKK